MNFSLKHKKTYKTAECRWGITMKVIKNHISHWLILSFGTYRYLQSTGGTDTSTAGRERRTGASWWTFWWTGRLIGLQLHKLTADVWIFIGRWASVSGLCGRTDDVPLYVYIFSACVWLCGRGTFTPPPLIRSSLLPFRHLSEKQRNTSAHTQTQSVRKMHRAEVDAICFARKVKNRWYI